MYQPFKTCPLCGQRAVVDMKTCGRCGYVFPCPPAPYYTPPDNITPGMMPRRFTAWKGVAATVLAFAAVVAVLFWMGQRPVTRGFVGTWMSDDRSGIIRLTFEADGTGSYIKRTVVATNPNMETILRDPRYVQTEPDRLIKFSWFNTGSLLTISTKDPDSRLSGKRVWSISDDLNVLSLMDPQYQSIIDYRRAN
jgi:hypothetical protein